MDATTTTQGSSALFPMPQQTQIPAAQLFPPPPPPSRVSSLSLSSSSSYSRHAPSITNFPILVLTVLGILTTSVLLLAYYVFVIRCCLNWHHRGSSSSSSTIAGGRGRRQHAATSSLPVSAEPRGLEDAAIRALPAFRYSRKKDAVSKSKTAPASECAVCLGEFEDDDRVRMLPGCLHVFHVPCIDTWLQGNANCPLCRADIATHCLRLPLPLPPLQPADQLDPGTEQEDEATTQAQQRAAAPETAGEAAAAAADNPQLVVDGEQRKSITACCHEIDIGSKDQVDERTAERKGDTVGAVGGEVHLHIHSILQGNTRSHSHRDDEHDSSSSSSAFTLV